MLVAIGVLIFPPALLVLALGMAALETRVSLAGVREQVSTAVGVHDADQLEAFIARQLGPVMDVYWSHPALSRTRRV